jgi:hypothetical protein
MAPIDTTTQFCLLAVAQGSDAYTVVVSFTKPPDAVDPTVYTDALNPSNYQISGTSSPSVASARRLSSFMFALTLSTAIEAGVYTVTANHIMSGTYGLETPSSLTFTASIAPKETLTQGNTNDTSTDILRRWLPPLYRHKEGWEAFLAAIATGDEYVRQNAYVAFNQLFLSTAVGSYLIQKASDFGIKYPAEVGMDDDSFRHLTIATTARKVVSDALSRILEVFYGEDATRANTTSGTVEPYDIIPGDSIVFTFDNRDTVSVKFAANDFGNISQALASEVASVMTRVFQAAGVSAYAKATEQEIGTCVTVYSGALGLAGSVEVVGGMAQEAFQFPTRLPLFTSISGFTPAWHCTRESQTEFRLTWDTSDAPSSPGVYLIDGLADIEVGDYVLLNFVNASTLRGSYEVTDVRFNVDALGNAKGYSWFAIQPTANFPEISNLGLDIVQTGENEIVFYRINRETVGTALNPSFIAQHQDASVDVILPVSTQVVKRTALDGAYPKKQTAVTVILASRSVNQATVTTLEEHGIPTDPGNPTLPLHPTMVELIDLVGLPFVPFWHGLQGAGRWSQPGRVLSIIDAHRFIMESYGADGRGENGTALVYTAPDPSTVVPGPFVLDPDHGMAITGISTTSLDSIASLRGIKELKVASTATLAAYADTGYLVFGFGTKYEIGPVRYVGIVDSTTILIDRTFVFPQDIPVGFDVTMLLQNMPWNPDNANTLGSFFITGSSSGRAAAQTFTTNATAAGINVNTRIIYPGDRALSGEGLPIAGQRISDKVMVWASDNVDGEVAEAHNE